MWRGGYSSGGADSQGIEVGVLWLDRRGESFLQRSDGGEILARPFYNVQTGLNTADLIAFPGLQTGEIRVRTASDLIGGEVNWRRGLSCGCDGCGCGCEGSGFDLLVGYRSLRYRDSVTIEDAVRPLTTPPATDRVAVRDAFYARSLFQGLQTGVAARLQLDSLFIDGRLVGGLGATLSSTDVAGSTALVLPNGAVTRVPGGLLALGSNIGSKNSADVAFLADFQFRVGYQITQNLSLSVSYLSLYLSSVKRAGSLIDLGVNPTQLPPGTLNGQPRPTLQGGDSDVWARGVSLNLELRY
jgi:hypothetical protein